MRQFRFLGYGEEHPYYGEGAFTVGEVYKATSIRLIDTFDGDDAEFIDDDRDVYHEDLIYFEEVEWDECRSRNEFTDAERCC